MTAKVNKASNASTGKKGGSCLKGCLVAFVVFVLFIVGVEVYRRYIVRRYNETFLETYVPKPEVAEIAQKTTMTDKAKFLFYKADPEFIGTDLFVEYCITRSGIELALACARSDTPGKPRSGPRVFLLETDNSEFADIMFPSAAHEVLHLVYHEFSSEEQKRIDTLIDNELVKHEDDTHVANIADIIKKNMGDRYQEELRGEFHSIFGVEYSDISPELEAHYAQYFADRKQLVSLSENSSVVQKSRKLDDLTWKKKQLESKLNILRGQISGNEPSDLVDQYNSMVNQYNALNREGSAVYKELEKFYKLINPGYSSP